MTKRKVVIFSAICILFVGLFITMSMCAHANKYPYPESEWHIKNQEMFEECFPRYTEYAIKVIEQYDIEYEYTVELVANNISLEIKFDDGFSLRMSFGHSSFKHGYIIQRLWAHKNTFEEATQIREEYFEIMHIVNEFSVYDLRGDNNTFIALLRERVELGKESSKSYLSFDYSKYSSYGLRGYEVNVVLMDDWYTICTFMNYLSDKSIIV